MSDFTQRRAAPSDAVRAIISEIRALPSELSRFTLHAAIEPAEGRRWQITVVDRGRGPDSRFHAVQTPGGAVPAWAPPESTYAVPDEAGLIAVLSMFRDHPELFSRGQGDALDEPGLEPYPGEAGEWEG